MAITPSPSNPFPGETSNAGCAGKGRWKHTCCIILGKRFIENCW